MKTQIGIALVACTVLSRQGLAESPFDGTWRLDPQRPDAGSKPDVIQLTHGEYTCRSCAQPYRLKADGRDYRIFGNTRYETLKVVVIDEHTIVRTGKRAGVAVEVSTVTVSPDGARMTEHQILTLAGGHKLDFTNQLARVSPGSKGSHAISGTWRPIESDLTNHDQDTTYKTTGDTLSMSDRMGRSFSARLDGTAAPYKGSAAFTTVSVKQIDNHTIEETDKKGTQIVRITTWAVDPDGTTSHVRSDSHGQVMQQTAHKIS